MNRDAFVEDGPSAAAPVRAWILPLERDTAVAFPLHQCVALAPVGEVVHVPGTSPSCVGMVIWQERWIPLIDLRQATRTAASHMLVLRYADEGGAPALGAVLAPALASMEPVHDEQWCA